MELLRELQLVELEILKETLRFFEENNITYYALGGTMLGAVRHKGFIPWDDDIDIGVPREDYERLLDLMDSLPETMKLCSFKKDKSYIYYFMRVEDGRYMVKSDRTEIEEVTPAWIDIFPLDGMPNGKLMRKLHGWNILFRRAVFQLSRFDQIVNTKRTNRPGHEKAIIWAAEHFHIQKLISRQKAFDRLDRTLKKYPYRGSDYNLNAMGAYKLREMVDKKIFGDGAMYPFEDISIRGPVQSDAYLTQLYGDWRTPADFEHHSVVEISREDNPAREGEKE